MRSRVVLTIVLPLHTRPRACFARGMHIYPIPQMSHTTRKHSEKPKTSLLESCKPLRDMVRIGNKNTGGDFAPYVFQGGRQSLFPRASILARSDGE